MPTTAERSCYLKKIIRYFSFLFVLLLFAALIPRTAQAASLAAPSLTKVSNKATGVQLTWTKVSKATGYLVLRNSPGKTPKKIAKVSGSGTLTYTDTTAVSGKSYVYSVRAYKKSSSTTKYSSYDKTGTRITYVAPPVLGKLKDTASGLKLTWSSVILSSFLLSSSVSFGFCWPLVALSCLSCGFALPSTA